MSMSNNKLIVKRVQEILNNLGYDISTGHTYEFLSQFANYNSWNVAKAKKVEFKNLEIAGKEKEEKEEKEAKCKVIWVADEERFHYWDFERQSNEQDATGVYTFPSERDLDFFVRGLEEAADKLALQNRDEKDHGNIKYAGFIELETNPESKIDFKADHFYSNDDELECKCLSRETIYTEKFQRSYLEDEE